MARRDRAVCVSAPCTSDCTSLITIASPERGLLEGRGCLSLFPRTYYFDFTSFTRLLWLKTTSLMMDRDMS